MAAPSVDGACQGGGVAVMQKAKGSGLFVSGQGGRCPMPSWGLAACTG